MSLDFSQKHPGAKPILTMDFSDRLNAGETILSATWTITESANGLDVSQDMLLGLIDISAPPKIRQQIQGGTSGTRYIHTCLATVQDASGTTRVVDGVVEQLVTVKP